MPKASQTKLKIIWTANQDAGDLPWSRIGIAWEADDGLLFMQLDSIPESGQLWLKDWEPKSAFGAEESR